MSRFARFSGPAPTPGKWKAAKESGTGQPYVDYKDVENLRRMMSPNGKIYPRKRLGTSSQEQKMICQAIKQARFMGLLPYTSATL